MMENASWFSTGWPSTGGGSCNVRLKDRRHGGLFAMRLSQPYVGCGLVSTIKFGVLVRAGQPFAELLDGAKHLKARPFQAVVGNLPELLAGHGG